MAHRANHSRTEQSTHSTITVLHIGSLLIIKVLPNKLPLTSSQHLIVEKVGVKDCTKIMIDGEIPEDKTLSLSLEQFLPPKSNFMFVGNMFARNNSMKELTVSIDQPEKLKGALRIEGHDLKIRFTQPTSAHCVAGQIVLSGRNVSQTIPEEKSDESSADASPIKFVDGHGSVTVETTSSFTRPPFFGQQRQYGSQQQQPGIYSSGSIHVNGGVLVGDLTSDQDIIIGAPHRSNQQPNTTQSRSYSHRQRPTTFSSSSMFDDRRPPQSSSEHQQGSSSNFSQSFSFSSSSNTSSLPPNVQHFVTELFNTLSLNPHSQRGPGSRR